MNPEITDELLSELDAMSDHPKLKHDERETIQAAARVLRKARASLVGVHNDHAAPPWLLTGDAALRIANEHRVTAPAVQAIAKQVHAIYVAAKR